MNRYLRQLKNLRWMSAVIVAQGFSTLSFAQIPPSELPRVSVTNKIDVRPTADLRLGDLRIEFEKTGLQTVGLQMHNLAIGHTLAKGDESGYSWLCFTAVHGSYAERWWLMSDDEFGGAPDYAITGVYVERLKSSVVSTTTCPEPPPQFLPASLDQRLWVGARATEISRALGSKAPSTGWHRYSNVTKRSDCSRCTEWFVQSWLDVKVEAGVVVALRAVQMTSS